MYWLEEIAYRVLPRVRPGRALADREWLTLRHVAEVVLEGCPVDVTPERVADNVEHFLAAGASKRAWRCRVLLVLVEEIARVTHGAPLSALDRAARRNLFTTKIMAGAHVYGLCAKVRYLVVMGAYGDAAAPDGTGFVRVRDRALKRRAAARIHLPLAAT